MVDINDRHPWEDNMGHEGLSFWRITGVHVDHTKEVCVTATFMIFLLKLFVMKHLIVIYLLALWRIFFFYLVILCNVLKG